MNLRTIFYYKYLFIIVITMLAFSFIFAYICDLYFGNYGIALLFGSLISAYAALPFFPLFRKDQKKLEKKKEHSDNDS